MQRHSRALVSSSSPCFSGARVRTSSGYDHTSTAYPVEEHKSFPLAECSEQTQQTTQPMCKMHDELNLSKSAMDYRWKPSQPILFSRIPDSRRRNFTWDPSTPVKFSHQTRSKVTASKNPSLSYKSTRSPLRTSPVLDPTHAEAYGGPATSRASVKRTPDAETRSSLEKEVQQVKEQYWEQEIALNNTRKQLELMTLEANRVPLLLKENNNKQAALEELEQDKKSEIQKAKNNASQTQKAHRAEIEKLNLALGRELELRNVEAERARLIQESQIEAVTEKYEKPRRDQAEAEQAEVEARRERASQRATYDDLRGLFFSIRSPRANLLEKLDDRINTMHRARKYWLRTADSLQSFFKEIWLDVKHADKTRHILERVEARLVTIDQNLRHAFSTRWHRMLDDESQDTLAHELRLFTYLLRFGVDTPIFSLATLVHRAEMFKYYTGVRNANRDLTRLRDRDRTKRRKMQRLPVFNRSTELRDVNQSLSDMVDCNLMRYDITNTLALQAYLRVVRRTQQFPTAMKIAFAERYRLSGMQGSIKASELPAKRDIKRGGGDVRDISSTLDLRNVSRRIINNTKDYDMTLTALKLSQASLDGISAAEAEKAARLMDHLVRVETAKLKEANSRWQLLPSLEKAKEIEVQLVKSAIARAQTSHDPGLRRLLRRHYTSLLSDNADAVKLKQPTATDEYGRMQFMKDLRSFISAGNKRTVAILLQALEIISGNRKVDRKLSATARRQLPSAPNDTSDTQEAPESLNADEYQSSFQYEDGIDGHNDQMGSDTEDVEGRRGLSKSAGTDGQRQAEQPEQSDSLSKARSPGEPQYQLFRPTAPLQNHVNASHHMLDSLDRPGDLNTWTGTTGWNKDETCRANPAGPHSTDRQSFAWSRPPAWLLTFSPSSRPKPIPPHSPLRKNKESKPFSTDASRSSLDFHIPEATLRSALVASKSSGGAYWQHSLYRSSKGEKVRVWFGKKIEHMDKIASEFLDEPILGFDMEWEMRPGKENIKENVSLIQIASESKIAIFHIAAFHGNTAEELMSPVLKEILESPRIVKTGVNIGNDFTRLHKFLGVEARGIFELSHLYKLVKYSAEQPEKVNKSKVALAEQVQDMLSLPLLKGPVRTSSWSKKLTPEQIAYAATDAYAGFWLYYVMEAKRLAMDPIPPRPALYELDQPIILGDGRAAPLPKSCKR